MEVKVKHHTYTGLDTLPDVFDDLAEARRHVARLLNRRRKQGYLVYTMQTGEKWEIEEPENATMVSDLSGTLRLDKEEPSHCAWCGGAYYGSEREGIFCQDDCYDS